MECNKDEAKRAMDIAERKVTEKDYNGAKKFANKARTLYPDMDGLKELLMMVDVYISGEKRICGEADWYGILGVDPLSADEVVRKQYRKLALMLHPDKNKCKGAEGAFKLISEAWSILSDNVRRFSYNIKRQIRPQQRFQTQSGFENVGDSVVSSGKARTKPASSMDRSNMDQKKESSTFWTMCNKCKAQYEYPRVYIDKTLLCKNCREGFFAAEITIPPSVLKPANLSSNQHHRSSKNQATDKSTYGTSSSREPAPSRKAGPDSRNATTQGVNVVQQAQDRLKRGFGESQEKDAARGFTNSDMRNFKKMKVDDSHMFGPFSGKWSSGNHEKLNTIGSRHSQIQGMLLPCEITKALMNKAQSNIFKRIPKMVSKMVEDMKALEKEVEKNNGPVLETSKDSYPNKDEVNAIVVPDSDFHNFDLDRSEDCFQEDQIWAAYDDEDGMPRFYARIQKVISLNPFKMRISWLNAKSCREFGPVDWIGSGFAKSCGDFRLGKYESTDALNAFSHKVHFTKGARGLLHILPKKGQVWALYRNWSPEWDKNTPDEVTHKYDMVEVLDDYTEDKQSVVVTFLLKAEGFMTVFRRSTDQNDVRKIPKEEMFRFSHQVPHYILTGEEAANAPKGYLELDPAATSYEFLSENAEAKESSKMDTEKNEPAKEKISTPTKEEMSINID